MEIIHFIARFLNHFEIGHEAVGGCRRTKYKAQKQVSYIFYDLVNSF